MQAQRLSYYGTIMIKCQVFQNVSCVILSLPRFCTERYRHEEKKGAQFHASKIRQPIWVAVFLPGRFYLFYVKQPIIFLLAFKIFLRYPPQYEGHPSREDDGLPPL